MEEKAKIKICSVVGPTASGKSKICVWLAKYIDGEIISADSMQIYKGMNIATAKLTAKEQQGIPHHMIDFLDMECDFSVAEYVDMANAIIADIVDRGKKPILVGGTGLYVDSLLNGTYFFEQYELCKIRQHLRYELNKYGPEYMFNKLKKLDRDSAFRTHPNNLKRVLRGLEQYLITGLKFSDRLELSKKNRSRFKVCKVGLNFLNRVNLYRQIELRVDKMISDGLVEEARSIFKINNSLKTSVQAIGYKEFFPYFLGEETLEGAILKLKQSTKKYAKRQLTWFRKDSEIKWFYVDEFGLEGVKNEVLNFVGHFFNIC